jgi:hypothetical protein
MLDILGVLYWCSIFMLGSDPAITYFLSNLGINLTSIGWQGIGETLAAIENRSSP